MACYFGCETSSNRIAWCLWTLFIIVSLGCWIGFGIGLGGCISNAADTNGPCQVLHQLGEETLASGNSTIQATSVEEFADQLCKSYGFLVNTEDYNNCIQCITVSSNCALTYGGVSLAAIIFGVLTFLPCFFFCCCANSAQAKYGASSY
mmetsp:Transcript_40855/g.104542  ORF Transcript_40855/g.104542 Transcript_40855/m.104542 type:complete len:149 (-) Transcript_40855:137-583(-)